VREATLSVPQNAQMPIAAKVTFSSPQASGPLSASLDWRRSEGEEWTIIVQTTDGDEVRLEDGGARLSINGEPMSEQGIGEYPDIYREFLALIDEHRSYVDVSPLRLVADCLLMGRRRTVEPVEM
jgi:D-galactose 1-dehydrogenase